VVTHHQSSKDPRDALHQVCHTCFLVHWALQLFSSVLRLVVTLTLGFAVGAASPALTSKGQLTPASTGGRGLRTTADTCTPSKPPLSCCGKTPGVLPCARDTNTMAAYKVQNTCACQSKLDLCTGLQTKASVRPVKEVLGSRKSVRRSKLPLPAKYDLVLQLFGKGTHHHWLLASRLS